MSRISPNLALRVGLGAASLCLLAQGLMTTIREGYFRLEHIPGTTFGWMVSLTSEPNYFKDRDPLVSHISKKSAGCDLLNLPGSSDTPRPLPRIWVGYCKES